MPRMRSRISLSNPFMTDSTMISRLIASTRPSMDSEDRKVDRWPPPNGKGVTQRNAQSFRQGHGSVLQAAIPQFQGAVHVRGDGRVMRHYHKGRALLAQFIDQSQYLGGGVRIEIAGRFVHQHAVRAATRARAMATRWRSPPDS